MTRKKTITAPSSREAQRIISERDRVIDLLRSHLDNQIREVGKLRDAFSGEFRDLKNEVATLGRASRSLRRAVRATLPQRTARKKRRTA